MVGVDTLEERVVKATELHPLIDEEGLEIVAELAQMAQANHAGAALQRVQIALQGLERCPVATVVAPVVDALIDGCEEFFGLLQEYLEHLGVGLL